jgi:hypothetical protein
MSAGMEGMEGNVANELDDGTDLLREGIRSISSCASHFDGADERAEMRLIADEMNWLLARAMSLYGRYQERHFPRTQAE